MRRREFTALALGTSTALAGLAASAPARAAPGDPIEGKDYKRLEHTVPLAEAGKVEVIEFFGFWCPHCFAFEAKLEPWAAQLPGFVNFRRIPVSWSPMHEPYQKLFFALQDLKQLPALQRKVFDAIHVQGLHLETEAGRASFARSNFIDPAKLEAALRGFSVDARSRQANQLFQAYQGDGVPTLAIEGRFITSPEIAGSEERALQVTDFLIRKSRTAG